MNSNVQSKVKYYLFKNVDSIRTIDINALDFNFKKCYFLYAVLNKSKNYIVYKLFKTFLQIIYLFFICEIFKTFIFGKNQDTVLMDIKAVYKCELITFFLITDPALDYHLVYLNCYSTVNIFKSTSINPPLQNNMHCSLKYNFIVYII